MAVSKKKRGSKSEHRIAKKIETLRVKEKSSKSARNGRKDRYGMKIQLTLE